jgi:tetratricopeptide (TPR) repeat protein
LIDNALPWYERYYQSTRDDAVAQRLADVLWGKGRETDAVAWYKKSAQATRSAIVAKRIADYHFTHGQQDISIEWYQKAVYSTEPLAKDALLFLTEHSEAAGDEKWMSIWSEKLGDAWHSEGDLPRAIECYAACEPKKLPSPKHLLVADTLMKQDKLMAALKWYKSYYDRTHDADLAKKVADQLWHKEKKERAVAWYKRYLSTKRSPHAVAIVGQYYIDQGEKDKAAQFYEEWSEVPKCLSKDAIAFMMEYCEERKNYAGSMLWAEKMGDEYCADGDTAKASEFYAKCDPKVLSPDKQLLVGDMYFARQEFTQGLKWYKRSYTQTKDVKLVRKSADALWKAGERKNAIVWYGEYAEKTRDPEIIRLVADYYISNKLENDAAIFYERFHHWATECIHSEGIAFMVRYYTDQKNHQGMEAWNAKYGDVLYAAGKKDEAIACYMQCSPDSLTYSMRIAVADAYFEKKEYDQGEHWYEACYKQSKDAALAQITADRLWDAGLEPRAISWYERYLSNNQNADVLKKIAAYWLEKSNFSEAQTWYDRYDAASSDAELSRKLGDLFLSAKQLEIAVGYYEKYIRSVTAPDAYVYVQLGQCYYAMEKNNMAFEKLAVAGWMLDRYKTKNPPSAPFEVQENDAVLVIENKYVFLKKDGKIFAAPATMIQEYRITAANLFNKGKAVLKLQKDRISQELPEIFEVSDNLKRDAAVHTALKEALSKRHVAICNV